MLARPRSEATCGRCQWAETGRRDAGQELSYRRLADERVTVRTTTDRSGVEIVYETSGGGGALPIVFVHGWCCNRSFFRPQIEHFGRQRPVVALDLRGHGESAGSEVRGCSIDDFADDVVAVIDEVGFERPVVVGHSMGGVIAHALAARTGVVQGAVLVDPAPLAGGVQSAQVFNDIADSCEGDDGEWRRKFVPGMLLPTDTVRRDDIVDTMAGTPWTMAADGMRAIARFISHLPAPATVPVLVIGAARPFNSWADLQRVCSDVTVGQTVGAGHFNQLEAPEQVNAMIERWLATALS